MERIFRETLQRFIELTLAEDVGSGDHTTLSTIKPNQEGKAILWVKEQGVIAGIEVAEQLIAFADPKLKTLLYIKDGATASPGDKVLEIIGCIHAILRIERLLLNIMQRMSGIATHTAQYIRALEGTNTQILDTRKTIPGMRFLDKEAVRIGGGVNHRFGLYDMILIKDNHIDYAGGITAALNNAFAYRKREKLNIPIEIEVRNLDELSEVLDAEKVDRVMLDNFEPDDVSKAVRMVDRRLITEASGGITLDTAREYAQAGVDYISVGALTHTVKSLDLSLKATIL